MQLEPCERNSQEEQNAGSNAHHALLEKQRKVEVVSAISNAGSIPYGGSKAWLPARHDGNFVGG
jgi:hypothetical protein